MPNAYFLASPLLYAGLGGEMVYILNQRLQAQSIDSEKAHRVLNDILCKLFEKEFIDNLMLPKVTLSIGFVRHLMETIVHCSIMKLNDQSMSKLYDLMVMGVKLQVYNSQSPHDIYFQTLNHLDGIVNIVQQGQCLENVLYFKKQFIKVYGNLNPHHFVQLRQEIFRFLQEKQVRVYMFIQEKTQNNDGSFIIVNNQETAAPFIGRPGEVVVYDAKGLVRKKKQLVLKVANNFKQSSAQGFLDGSRTEWGSNLYAIERQQRRAAEGAAGAGGSAYQGTRRQYEDDEQLKSALNVNPELAKREMLQLAQLIGVRNDDDDDARDDFTTISLFRQNTGSTDRSSILGAPISRGGSSVLGLDDDWGNDFKLEMVVFDTQNQNAHKKKIEDMLKDLELDSKPNNKQGKSNNKKQQEEEEDEEQKEEELDLLAMMDNITN